MISATFWLSVAPFRSDLAFSGRFPKEIFDKVRTPKSQKQKAWRSDEKRVGGKRTRRGYHSREKEYRERGPRCRSCRPSRNGSEEAAGSPLVSPTSASSNSCTEFFFCIFAVNIFEIQNSLGSEQGCDLTVYRGCRKSSRC